MRNEFDLWFPCLLVIFLSRWNIVVPCTKTPAGFEYQYLGMLFGHHLYPTCLPTHAWISLSLSLARQTESIPRNFGLEVMESADAVALHDQVKGFQKNKFGRSWRISKTVYTAWELWLSNHVKRMIGSSPFHTFYLYFRLFSYAYRWRTHVKRFWMCVGQEISPLLLCLYQWAYYLRFYPYTGRKVLDFPKSYTHTDRMYCCYTDFFVKDRRRSFKSNAHLIICHTPICHTNG